MVDPDREAALALRRARRAAARRCAAGPSRADGLVGAIDCGGRAPVPTPPFFGTRVVRGIALADYAAAAR